MNESGRQQDVVTAAGPVELSRAQATLVELLREASFPIVVHEPLARHTSLKAGGPADLYLRVFRLDRLCHAVGLARDCGVPYLILGRGSNVLVSDRGFRGCVIENRCQRHRIAVDDDGEGAVLYAESGASLPALAQQTAHGGWAGLEWAVGIPGSVGSAVVNNAGAHGGCIADVLRCVRVLTRDGEIVTWGVEDLQMEYRGSRLKGRHGEEVILSAEFGLGRDSPDALSRRMAEFNERRRSTQPTDPSLGSFFKNPAGDYAGRLIDQTGLKGTRVGGAMISPVHANFFVNAGEATATDFMALVELVRDTVHRQFGIELDLEIELIGEW